MTKVLTIEGDVVMDPKFKLNRSFNGPFGVHSMTVTSAIIQPINKPDEEAICVLNV